MAGPGTLPNLFPPLGGPEKTPQSPIPPGFVSLVPSTVNDPAYSDFLPYYYNPETGAYGRYTVLANGNYGFQTLSATEKKALVQSWTDLTGGAPFSSDGTPVPGSTGASNALGWAQLSTGGRLDRHSTSKRESTEQP